MDFQSRRHPAPMIYWRSICDLFLSVAILLSSEGLITSCKDFSWFVQFTFVAAESWWLMISIDLWQSVTNPFTNYKRNLKIYHSYVWLVAALTAALLFAGVGRCSGRFAPGVCWLRLSPWGRRDWACGAGYFFGWAAAYVLVAAAAFARARAALARHGGQRRALGRRVRVLAATRAAVLGYGAHLALLALLAGAAVGFWWDSDLSHRYWHLYVVLHKTAAFVFCSKGCVDLAVWVWCLPCCGGGGMGGGGGGPAEELDGDLSPQLNRTLRAEIVRLVSEGVRRAAALAEEEAQALMGPGPGPGPGAGLVGEVLRASVAVWTSWFAHPEFNRLAMGPFLTELLAALLPSSPAAAAAAGGGEGGRRRRGRPGDRPRLALFSAHDNTLVPLLVALGAYDGELPPYAALLTLEVAADRATGERFLRVVYNHREVVAPVGTPLDRQEGIWVPLESFRAQLAQRIPGRTMGSKLDKGDEIPATKDELSASVA